MEPRSSVLSLRGVALSARQRGGAGTVDFDLAHREVAVVELDEDSDAGAFVDLCLGLVEPPSGEVYCLGQTWSVQGYHDRLAHRSRIGAVIDSQIWPAHMPVAQVALAPLLYHTAQAEAEALAEATILARRFGRALRESGSCVAPGRSRAHACAEAEMKRSPLGVYQFNQAVGAVVLI